MYEAVHARPGGESTVARLALTAADCGFDGIVVRNHGDAPAGYDPAEVAEAYGVDVVTGVEVRAEDPSRASGYVGNHRRDHEIVAVHGGDPAINRFAVEQPAVDVLAHPTAGDGGVNHVLARAAADNGVRLEVSLAPVLRESGGSRVRAIAALRTLAEVIDQYDAPYVVSADPRNHLELRAPRELAAVGEVLGVDDGWVNEGLAEWSRLAERNRERTAAEFVEPGVRRETGGSADDETEGSP